MKKLAEGFTLVELLIYIVIVSVILLAAFNFGWEMIYGNVKSQAIRETQQNARFAMETIAREIKRASSINSPLAGSSSDTLSLEMANPNFDPTVFDVSGGKLRISRGISGPYELTNNRVSVSNLQFANLSYPDTPGTVRAEMEISHINPVSKSEYQASFSLSSTVSLLPGGAGVPGQGYCQGTPSACSTFLSETDCGNQQGCLWTPGYCEGTCTACLGLNRGRCRQQDGCFWLLFFCFGACTSCDSLSDENLCEDQRGCSWINPYCSSTPTSCDQFTDQSSCVLQEGCEWVMP